jgi:hypothetical protein
MNKIIALGLIIGLGLLTPICYAQEEQNTVSNTPAVVVPQSEISTRAYKNPRRVSLARDMPADVAHDDAAFLTDAPVSGPALASSPTSGAVVAQSPRSTNRSRLQPAVANSKNDIGAAKVSFSDRGSMRTSKSAIVGSSSIGTDSRIGRSFLDSSAVGGTRNRLSSADGMMSSTAQMSVNHMNRIMTRRLDYKINTGADSY